MENIAIASKESAPISMKNSVEISSFIRGKTTDKAKNLLLRVLEKKVAVPFKRYYHDITHKKGDIAAGKYPIATAKYFIELIEDVEANAKQKGMVQPYKIIYLVANKGPKTWHYGRARRIAAKRTHLEIKVREVKKEQKEPLKKAETKTQK